MKRGHVHVLSAAIHWYGNCNRKAKILGFDDRVSEADLGKLSVYVVM